MTIISHNKKKIGFKIRAPEDVWKEVREATPNVETDKERVRLLYDTSLVKLENRLIGTGFDDFVKKKKKR